MDGLDAVEAQVEKVRQIDKLAALLGKFNMPKPAQIMLATELYDGGARVELEPLQPATDVPADAPADAVESPLRARLRAENPELVAKIEAAEQARRAGDATAHLNLLSEIRPAALAELEALKAQGDAVNPKDFA